jgi:hypothetical protein
LSFNAEVDISNIRLIHFTFINGDTVGNRFNLDNAITWDFGDGNSETTQGLEASHTYAAAGTYKVLANFTLHSGDASCTNYIEKTLSVD